MGKYNFVPYLLYYSQWETHPLLLADDYEHLLQVFRLRWVISKKQLHCKMYDMFAMKGTGWYKAFRIQWNEIQDI